MYSFIAAEKSRFPVAGLCRVLRVNRTAFHNWERRPPSDRALTDAWLTEKIRRIHAESRRIPDVAGGPRAPLPPRRRSRVLGSTGWIITDRAWLIEHSFVLAIADLPRFVEHYERSLQQVNDVEVVILAPRIGSTGNVEGSFTVRASTVPAARRAAFDATTRAWKAAWESLSEPAGIAWTVVLTDPVPMESPD